ncbi:ATP-binding protein [Streptomyces sp. NPDC101225]|uniref:ATP-binding protein n=1 Tax=Streptomyces sp. NPDC101225 TaxID=3366135 RepID=UPI0038231ECC
MTPALGALHNRHVLTLPNEPSAVRLSRETAEQALAEWGIGLRQHAVDVALLILGELVTNCVRHAAELSPQIMVMYAASGQHLSFAVHDRDPHQPSLHRTGGTGGGLGMVAELTRQLGGTAVVHGDAEGKSIAITLPL